MHSVFFNLKRAHQQTLAFARMELRPFNITPQRFDFLYAIYRHPHHACFMSEVRIALGCVWSNISRYVKVAEKKGWITWDWDGHVMLFLTQAAVDLIERIVARTNTAIEDRVGKCALADEEPRKIEPLQKVLQRMRSVFWDARLLDIYAEAFVEEVCNFVLVSLQRARDPCVI